MGAHAGALGAWAIVLGSRACDAAARPAPASAIAIPVTTPTIARCGPRRLMVPLASYGRPSAGVRTGAREPMSARRGRSTAASA